MSSINIIRPQDTYLVQDTKIEYVKLQTCQDSQVQFTEWSPISSQLVVAQIKTVPSPYQDGLVVYIKDFGQSIGSTNSNGLKFDYFVFTGGGTPNINNVQISETGIHNNVIFNWGNIGTEFGDKTNYGFIWTGYIKPITSGQYKFKVFVDNGARLYINNSLVINSWGVIPPRSLTTSDIYLEKDQLYPIRLEFFNEAGPGQIQLSWSNNGVTWTNVPDDALYFLEHTNNITNSFKLITKNPVTFFEIQTNWSSPVISQIGSSNFNVSINGNETTVSFLKHYEPYKILFYFNELLQSQNTEPNITIETIQGEFSLYALLEPFNLFSKNVPIDWGGQGYLV